MSSTVRRAEVSKLNRREFLYYLGGASLALLAAGAGAVVYKFAQPSAIPTGPGFIELDFNILWSNTVPVPLNDVLGWLIPSDVGLLALSGRCTARGCLTKWVTVNDRFECPCCGSKFQLDGTRITGIAGRDLDRFTLWIETPHSIFHTPQDGSPVPIADATRIWVDTRTKIPGPPRT